MKPAPFVYHDPSDLDAALRLLAEHGDGARVLAGGQSLLPMLNFRIARPGHLIDLRRIAGLSGVQLSGSRLLVGATTTHRTVETDPLVRAHVPLLSEAVAQVGHIPIRERGTLGGSLSLADPTAEMPLVAAVLEAELTVESLRGRRTVPASKFFHSALQTDLADDEILTGVSFPVLGAGTGTSFLEFARRKGDFAIVGVAAVVAVEDGRYRSVRVGLCGVSDRPFISAQTTSLVGEPVGEAAARHLADVIAAELDPTSDRRAEAEDRRDIARALVRRTLTLAAERAGAATPTHEGVTR